jgi:TonB family protein
VSLPVAIHRVEPEKPAGVAETGRVILEMVIGIDGSPRDIVVLQAPHPELGRVSVEAARDWKFRPAMCHGVPVATIFNIQVTFH